MPGPHLLVSVRDAVEAVAALAGGADLIDIKEPSRGALGRADAATITAIVQAVAGRAPVSAALGELCESGNDFGLDYLPPEVQYVKWGLSGLSQKPWQRRLTDARNFAAHREVVTVAYADWVRAEAPPPADVAEDSSKILLIDTFGKDGSTLLDWLSIDEVAALVRQCRDASKRIALAGSLTAAEINRLREVQPDWFAVRGAACDGSRNGTISEHRVRELAKLVHSHQK